MWHPRWHHVTQWGTGGDPGSGSNNCAEASMARAILEYDPATPARAASRAWELVRQIHDPASPEGVQDLINVLSIRARGAPNGPWNGFTSAAGIQQALSAYSLAWRVIYTSDTDAGTVLDAVDGSALALLWVDGSALAPSSYSGSFFGGDWGYDHIILSLPDGNLVNDPLSDVPDRQTDVRYSWEAIGGAIGGAWLLPAPEGLSTTATLRTAAALKVAPNHICRAVVQLPTGASVTLLPQRTPHWQHVRWNALTGWLLLDNLEG